MSARSFPLRPKSIADNLSCFDYTPSFSGLQHATGDTQLGTGTIFAGTIFVITRAFLLFRRGFQQKFQNLAKMVPVPSCAYTVAHAVAYTPGNGACPQLRVPGCKKTASRMGAGWLQKMIKI